MRHDKVKVIRPDRSGHFAGEMAVEELQAYPWTARKEAVVINNVQVETFEDFLRAVDGSEATPEVWFFPPMVGG